MTEEERRCTRKICSNITLHTANGLTKVTDAVALSVDELAEPIYAHLLESTPNVISMGHRCMELGYTFIWRARQTPFLICPNGKKIDLVVKHNVPYLPPSECRPTRSIEKDLDFECAVGTKIDVKKSQFESSTPAGPSSHGGSSSSSAVPTANLDDESIPIPPVPDQSDDEIYTLGQEAKTTRHLMTHLPFNPYCSTCQRAKWRMLKGESGWRNRETRGQEVW